MTRLQYLKIYGFIIFILFICVNVAIGLPVKEDALRNKLLFGNKDSRNRADTLIEKSAALSVVYENAKSFGEYKPFTVEQFFKKFNIKRKEAELLLNNLWLNNDNIDKLVNSKGITYYQYAPIKLALQIGPEDMPCNLPAGVSTVLIGHSETKEFLNATPERSNEQIREFAKAGIKMIVAFGDFPQEYKGKNYIESGIRIFPLSLQNIVNKADSIEKTDPLYDDFMKLKEEALSVNNSSIENLLVKYSDLTQAFDIKNIEEIPDRDVFKSRIIAELSTQMEIENEVKRLFKGLSPEIVLKYIYARAYEPVEGIRGVAISPKIAGYRVKYIKKAITDTVMGSDSSDPEKQIAKEKFQSELTITYGGGCNVKNIIPMNQQGYDGGLIGRASSKPKAPDGEDSTANIAEAASLAKNYRIKAMFNTKATETPAPNEFIDGFREKNGLNLETDVQAVFTVSLLDFSSWQRALRGEDVRGLFDDATKRKALIMPDITIRAGLSEATQPIGAFTRHHSAEILAKAGVTQVIIDPAKPYAVIQAKNLIDAGINPVILSAEHNNRDIARFKSRFLTYVKNDPNYVDVSFSLDYCREIFPISAVREIREKNLENKKRSFEFITAVAISMNDFDLDRKLTALQEARRTKSSL